MLVWITKALVGLRAKDDHVREGLTRGAWRTRASGLSWRTKRRYSFSPLSTATIAMAWPCPRPKSSFSHCTISPAFTLRPFLSAKPLLRGQGFKVSGALAGLGFDVVEISLNSWGLLLQRTPPQANFRHRQRYFTNVGSLTPAPARDARRGDQLVNLSRAGFIIVLAGAVKMMTLSLPLVSAKAASPRRLSPLEYLPAMLKRTPLALASWCGRTFSAVMLVEPIRIRLDDQFHQFVFRHPGAKFRRVGVARHTQNRVAGIQCQNVDALQRQPLPRQDRARRAPPDWAEVCPIALHIHRETRASCLNAPGGTAVIIGAHAVTAATAAIIAKRFMSHPP